MKSIQKVKDWVKKPQFHMVHFLTDADGKHFYALRYKDNQHFDTDSLSKVFHKNRRASILDFSADSITVLIEKIKQPLGLQVATQEYKNDPDNYDYIWVPINDIEKRES